MTKRLIDVDDDKLEAVRTLLGTRTLKATVDDAFSEVLALAERRQALLAERGVEPEALADPVARLDAWAEGLLLGRHVGLGPARRPLGRRSARAAPGGRARRPLHPY